MAEAMDVRLVSGDRPVHFGAMTIRGWAVLGVVAAAASGLACSSTEPLVKCKSGVVLSISTGAAPRFDWSPACLAYRIDVEDSAGATIWSVQAAGGDSIAPGVVYGDLPHGAATQTVAPQPLQSGRQYGVFVFRYIGPAAADVDNISAKLFTQP